MYLVIIDIFFLLINIFLIYLIRCVHKYFYLNLYISNGEQRPLTWRCSVQFSAVSQQQDELQQEEDKVTHLFQVSLSIAHATPISASDLNHRVGD